MVDWANWTIKASRAFGQLVCDELAASACQTALRNDSKPWLARVKGAQENSHRAGGYFLLEILAPQVRLELTTLRLTEGTPP